MELPEMFLLVATAGWDSIPPPPTAAPTAVPKQQQQQPSYYEVQQLTIGLHSTSSNHRSNNCIMHCNS
jgi:hypothetical protein